MRSAQRPLHPVSVVTRRTGLSADVLRAWERRYRAVTPSRSAGNQRLYSDAQVERLLLLRRAVQAGWPIGHLVPRSDTELRALVEAEAPAAAAAAVDDREARPSGPSATRRATTPPAGHEALRSRAQAALARLDGDGLAAALDDATAELGRVVVLDRFLAPFLAELGDAVASGALRIAHEHLASATVLRFLETLAPAYAPEEGAPRLVATTTAGVHHALGAALVAAAARVEGWRATYLGPNLPAEEIAAAARVLEAEVVALSLVPPLDAARTDAELARLGRLLGGRARVVVGGAAAPGHRAAVEAAGGIVVRDLSAFRLLLRDHGAGPARR